MTPCRPLILLYLIWHSLLYIAPALSSTEDLHWPDDELETIEQVNEGSLDFLVSPSTKPILHAINTLTITPDSINSGWVVLEQCYLHLDQVNRAIIIYQYKHMRNLKLVSSHNIGTVTLKGQSAELTNVIQDAKICISAEVRNFYQNPDLSFSLINGPYHRRFLDGYYPYHLTLQVMFKDTGLHFVDSKPEIQTGFNITHHQDRILIETLFEGMLNIELNFRLLSTSK